MPDYNPVCGTCNRLYRWCECDESVPVLTTTESTANVLTQYISPPPPLVAPRPTLTSAVTDAFAIDARVNARRDARQPHVMRGYSYKPAALFHGHSARGLYIGIEQELEPRTRWGLRGEVWDMLDANDRGGLIYAKEDGSLVNGIELVTHPMSLFYFRTEYPWSLWAPGSGLGQYLRQSSRTGVHIHVSKDAFSKAHMYRFLAFHYLYPGFIETVAGRGSNSYTNVRPFRYPTDYRVLRGGLSHAIISNTSRYAKGDSRGTSRYQAVNVRNEDTLELRYFRSTVHNKRLLFYADWVEALYEYTEQGWIRSYRPDRILSPNGMYKWVDKQHRTRFPELRKFMAKNSYYRDMTGGYHLSRNIG